MPAFTVEDGTGLETSTSYVDIDFADDYLGTDWASDNNTKQSALQSATEYADARWGAYIQGSPLSSIQALEMPRNGLRNRYGHTISGIPAKWKNAVCIYAKAALDGSLYPTPPSGSSKELTKKKITVGPITTENEYQAGGSDSSSWLDFPLADNLCSGFLTGGKSGFNSSGGRVMR